VQKNSIRAVAPRAAPTKFASRDRLHNQSHFAGIVSTIIYSGWNKNLLLARERTACAFRRQLVRAQSLELVERLRLEHDRLRPRPPRHAAARW